MLIYNRENSSRYARVSNADVGLEVFIFYSHSCLTRPFENRSNNIINNNIMYNNMYVTTTVVGTLYISRGCQKKINSKIDHHPCRRQDCNISLLAWFVLIYL